MIYLFVVIGGGKYLYYLWGGGRIFKFGDVLFYR